MEEISGVAFIFNQKFFNDLNEAKGILLENIVYYKVQFLSASSLKADWSSLVHLISWAPIQ